MELSTEITSNAYVKWTECAKKIVQLQREVFNTAGESTPFPPGAAGTRGAHPRASAHSLFLLAQIALSYWNTWLSKWPDLLWEGCNNWCLNPPFPGQTGHRMINKKSDKVWMMIICIHKNLLFSFNFTLDRSCQRTLMKSLSVPFLPFILVGWFQEVPVSKVTSGGPLRIWNHEETLGKPCRC